MTPNDDQIPPPPPFAVPTDLDPSSEIDVDLYDECPDYPDDDQGELVLTRDTIPDGCDHLGSHASLELYFRSQLEDQVSAPCQWLLDCLDMKKVRARFESDGSRLVCESGEVYRLAAPEPDPAGPGMPGRH